MSKLYRSFWGGGGGAATTTKAAAATTTAAATAVGRGGGHGHGHGADKMATPAVARQPSEKHRGGGGGGGNGHGNGNPPGNGKQWFNPEDFTSEKRQWVAMQKAHNQAQSRPVVTSPFEYFLVAGLPTTADVSGVAASAKAAKAARQAGAEVPVSDPKAKRFYRGTSGETFPAEVLFSYPPGGGPLHVDSP
jgi:hypothetical protein